MKTPVSMIIVGKDPQVRASTRLQLMGSGRVHIVAETGETSRVLQMVEKFKPQSALIMLNGQPEESYELIREIGNSHPSTAIVCSGIDTPSEQIVRAFRAGAAEFLCQPFSMSEIHEVVEKVQAVGVSSGAEESRAGGVIACYSARGGSGSTSMAVNLAATLVRQTKKPTVIVDLNLQSGTVPLFFGVEPVYSIADMAHNQDRLDAQLLKSFLTKSIDDLYCLAAPLKVEEADDVHPAHIERMLPLLTGQFGYVVIDCPHTLDSNTVPVLDLASVILIISLLDLPSIYTSKRILEVFRKMGYEENKTKLLINRYSKESNLPLTKVEQTLGCKVTATLSEDSKNASTAMNLGTPLVLSQPKSPLVKQYADLARMIVGKDDTAERAEKKRGFRLFGGK